MEKGKPERRKLKVLSIGIVENKARKDGQGTFPTINFNADDITDPASIKKNYRYSVANPILIPVIQKTPIGEVIEADVQKLTGITQEGKDWTIHQVVQIYKDGQAISGGRKGGNYGKSLEQMQFERETQLELEALKRVSIEGQKAAELAITAFLGLRDIGSDSEALGQVAVLFEKALDWCESKISGPSAVLSTHKSTEKPLQTEKIEDKGQRFFKNVGELLKACLDEYGMNRENVMAELGVTNPKEILDLYAAWGTISKTHKIF